MTTYFAESPETAWREVRARWLARKAAYQIVEARARLTRVLDLTETTARLQRNTSQDALIGPAYGACQALADSARSEGFEAIRTYSAADYPDGRQLVVFLDCLDSSSSLSIVSVRDIDAALKALALASQAL